MTNWDDYRYLLAIADHGTLSAASKTLDVSQPTVGRRLSELEKRLEAHLFDRTPDGYRLTSTGEKVAAHARSIEQEARSIERDATIEDRSAAGRVVLTATEDFASNFVTPLLGEFKTAYPAIEIQLLCAYQALDIMRREADIAIRIGELHTDELVGRRLTDIRFGLYASPDYLEANGTPQTVRELRNHAIVESIGATAQFKQSIWLRQKARGARIAFSSDNLLNQILATEEGLGVFAMPCSMAYGRPRLKRLLTDEFDLTLEAWVLTHRLLRNTTRIRAVLDFFSQHLSKIPAFE
jgi:DNA-binding transcriptional LysR family regulator